MLGRTKEKASKDKQKYRTKLGVYINLSKERTSLPSHSVIR